MNNLLFTKWVIHVLLLIFIILGSRIGPFKLDMYDKFVVPKVFGLGLIVSLLFANMVAIMFGELWTMETIIIFFLIMFPFLIVMGWRSYKNNRVLK